MPEAAKKTLERASVGAIMMSPEMIGALESMAQLMAGSKCTMPAHLQGNVPDCFAVAMQSLQWGMNPFAVAQKTHIVQGSLGYEAQLINAVVEKSGAIVGQFVYDWFGPWERVIGKFRWMESAKGNKYQVPDWKPDDEKGCGVKVSAVLSSNKQTVYRSILLSQATVRNSTLWASDPQQQLAYLAVKRWARLYTPGAILGVYTSDELEEVGQERPQNFAKPSHFGEIKPKGEINVEGSASGKSDAPVVEAEPAQEPKGEEPTRSGYITADQFRTIDEARKKGKASGDKFLSGLRVFFGIENTRDIKVEQLAELIEWAVNGCKEPSAKAPSADKNEAFEFNGVEA
jgi:hypothetical protein